MNEWKSGKCNNFSIWRFAPPIYLLYIWEWLFKLKLMKMQSPNVEFA